MGSLDIEVAAGSVRALPIAATWASTTPIAGPCWLYGWSLVENTGAATTFVDITSGGNTVAVVELPASGTDSQWFGPLGIRVESGLTLSAISGQFWGAVYVGYESC